MNFQLSNPDCIVYYENETGRHWYDRCTGHMGGALNDEDQIHGLIWFFVMATIGIALVFSILRKSGE